MISRAVFQIILLYKNKRGELAISTIGKLAIGLIALAVIIGLIIFWSTKTNSNIDNIPGFLEGLP